MIYDIYRNNDEHEQNTHTHEYKNAKTKLSRMQKVRGKNDV